MQRADVVEIVGQSVRLKKRGTNHIGNCPFHNEKTPSFNVNPARGIFKCFGCGKGGNVVTFVQEHEKVSYPEAIRWLADFYKIELQETERTPEQVQQGQAEESLRIAAEWAAKWFESQLATDEGAAIGGSYFKERGFRKDTVEKFRLGYCPENGHSLHKAAAAAGHKLEYLEKLGPLKLREGGEAYDVYRGRVIFPIQNPSGRVLGFGARILKKNDKAPKYINSPENELYNKSRVLYGLHQSRAAVGKLDECFLVEGYTDVISLHQGGVENVVSSSGTALTEDQLKIIGRLTKNLTILYDGDAAGIKAALRGMDMALAQSFNVQLVLLPDGEDPDSFVQKSGAARFHEYVKEHKQDVIGFRIEVGMAGAETNPVAKNKLVNEIAETVSKMSRAEDFALRDHYLKTAAVRLGVDQEGFTALVNKYVREGLEADARERGVQRRREGLIPDAPPLPDDRLPEMAPRTNPEEEQEWSLIRVLIEHGAKPWEGYANVAALITDRVAPEVFETPLARQVFDLYAAEAAAGAIPSEDFFIGHHDEAIRAKAASLLHPGEGLSPNWGDKYGIEIPQGEAFFAFEVESALDYFDLRKLKGLQRTLIERLAVEKDAARQDAMLQRYTLLKTEEAEILRRAGTVIVR